MRAEEDDAVGREAGFLGGGERGGEVGGLGDEGFCARVAQLEGQLVDRVEGVGRGDGSACPQGAEGEDGGL